MLPASWRLFSDSKSNSSTLFPSTTTTRVSSAWVASISIFLAILSVCTAANTVNPAALAGVQFAASVYWWRWRAQERGRRLRHLPVAISVARASSRFLVSGPSGPTQACSPGHAVGQAYMRPGVSGPNRSVRERRKDLPANVRNSETRRPSHRVTGLTHTKAFRAPNTMGKMSPVPRAGRSEVIRALQTVLGHLFVKCAARQAQFIHHRRDGPFVTAHGFVDQHAFECLDILFQRLALGGHDGLHVLMIGHQKRGDRP